MDHFFLEATIRMAKRQINKLEQAERLFEEGLNKIQQPSTEKVWGALFKYPIATVHQIEKETQLAPVTIRKSLNQLIELSFIYGDDKKRNRRFFHYDLIRIIND